MNVVVIAEISRPGAAPAAGAWLSCRDDEGGAHFPPGRADAAHEGCAAREGPGWAAGLFSTSTIYYGATSPL